MFVFEGSMQKACSLIPFCGLMIQFSFFICCYICLLFLKLLDLCYSASSPPSLPLPPPPKTSNHWQNLPKKGREKKNLWKSVRRKVLSRPVFSIYEWDFKLSQQVIFLFNTLTLGERNLPIPNLWLYQREAQLFASLRTRPGHLSWSSKFAADYRPQPCHWIANTFFIFSVEAAAQAMIPAFCLFWEALCLRFHSTESAAEPQHSTGGNFKWLNFPQNSSCQACHMGKKPHPQQNVYPNFGQITW